MPGARQSVMGGGAAPQGVMGARASMAAGGMAAAGVAQQPGQEYYSYYDVTGRI